MERTLNMRLMVFTLEVSRLSGWSNTDAYCRVKREGERVAATAREPEEGI